MPSKKKKYNARFPPVSLNFAKPVWRRTNVSKLCDGKLTYFASLNGIRPVLLPTELTSQLANANLVSLICELHKKNKNKVE